MDSFKIHGQVIADYRGYIESFINIRDEQILTVVQKALSEGRLWPEPLIQFNPSYKITGDLAAVVASEKLHLPLLHSNLLKACAASLYEERGTADIVPKSTLGR